MIIEFFRKLDRMLMHLAGWVIILASIILIILVAFLVLDRLAIGTSWMGIHELALMAAMWLYMIGAIVALRNREHITVDYLASKIANPRWASVLALVNSLIVLFITIFFARLALDLLNWATTRPQRTPALGLSQLWAQSAIIVAAGFAVIYAVRDLFVAAISFRSKQP
ncbi:MAG: TRAP transporter small permease subunit [Rhodobacteraceae bacterium]|nr:MAG: TRAP transporter small permease subunit [Paracoccaceae bacterium]